MLSKKGVYLGKGSEYKSAIQKRRKVKWSGFIDINITTDQETEKNKNDQVLLSKNITTVVSHAGIPLSQSFLEPTIHIFFPLPFMITILFPFLSIGIDSLFDVIVFFLLHRPFVFDLFLCINAYWFVWWFHSSLRFIRDSRITSRSIFWNLNREAACSVAWAGLWTRNKTKTCFILVKPLNHHINNKLVKINYYYYITSQSCFARLNRTQYVLCKLAGEYLLLLSPYISACIPSNNNELPSQLTASFLLYITIGGPTNGGS